MKRTLTLAIAAAATFAAASPAQAALTPSGVSCSTTDVDPTATDCSGWWSGNLLDFGKSNGASYQDQLDAMKALFDDLGYTWSGNTVVESIGSVAAGTNTLDFTGYMSGDTIIGIHRGGGNNGDQSATAFFRWSNLSPTDKITLNLAGLSGGNLYLTTFTQVPEPGTWMLMIAGIGLMGWQLRRRRQTVKVSYA